MSSACTSTVAASTDRMLLCSAQMANRCTSQPVITRSFRTRYREAIFLAIGAKIICYHVVGMRTVTQQVFWHLADGSAMSIRAAKNGTCLALATAINTTLHSIPKETFLLMMRIWSGTLARLGIARHGYAMQQAAANSDGAAELENGPRTTKIPFHLSSILDQAPRRELCLERALSFPPSIKMLCSFWIGRTARFIRLTLRPTARATVVPKQTL